MPIIGSSKTAVAASGLLSELGDSSAVGRGRDDRPDHDQQHCNQQAPTVNQRLIPQFFAPDDGHEDVRKMLNCI
jgi:hypothetical protein